MINFKKWEKCYRKILNDFGFKRKEDEKSAECLNQILSKREHLSFNELKNYTNEISDSNLFIVFGAGPSIKKHLNYVKKHSKKFKDHIIVAADGATSALLEEDIIPDIIVTDLDGKIDDLLIANSKGAVFIIHGHGNNLDLIKKYTNRFDKVLGTTQSTPLKNVYNFGGFTDGDRAIFLVESLGAKKIVLGGMDFGKYVTNYSRPNIEKNIEIADNIKVKKLKYAKKIVKWIKKNKDVCIFSIDEYQLE
ncbi:MAG: DUF115 domain-containing protein [Methanobrevibacter sp.]|jgi:uncharacterized Rossmann fold enzyme|nr:DUF115 domain-containing protein [Candidatus Methanovirga basalitermitum]